MGKYTILIILSGMAKKNPSIHNKETHSKNFTFKEQNSTLGIFDKAVYCSSLFGREAQTKRGRAWQRVRPCREVRAPDEATHTRSCVRTV